MAGARSLVYVPKGTLHAHRAIGVGMGRMLVSQTPGGEAGPLAFVGRQGVGELAEIAAEYGTEITPPIMW